MKLENCKKLSDLTYEQMISLRQLCSANYCGMRLPQHSTINSPAYSGKPAKRDRRKGRKYLKQLNCTLEELQTAIAEYEH